MLLITFVSTSFTATWEHHAGDKVPESRKSPEAINQITSVQADCDELDIIRDEIQVIPWVLNTRVQRWYGDHAKFIWNHMANRK